MDPWTALPPEDEPLYHLEIRRTPAAKPLIGIITSTDIIGRMTHFAKNRTLPCEAGDRCPWCEEGFSRRWHGYLAAIDPTSYAAFLFEFTARASDPFRNYMEQYSSLRACRFTARRPSGRPNGRIQIACARLDATKLRLPDPPDVKRALCHIWNIPYKPHRPNGMTRPPFKDIPVAPGDGDGRYRP